MSGTSDRKTFGASFSPGQSKAAAALPRAVAKPFSGLVAGCAPMRPCAAAGQSRGQDCLHCEIRHLSICAALEEDELAHLEAVVTGSVLPPGGMLFDEGEPANHVFNVTRGTIRLYKLLPDGRRQITGFMLPGDFIGLSARDGYAYSAEAVTETELCRFPLRELRILFERFPKLEARLLTMTGDELAAAQDQMLLLGRKNPMEKIASFLLNISNRAQRWGQPASPVLLPMSRGDIADFLGLTVETVSRTFTRLKSDGVIELPESTRVVLKDVSRLEEMAGGGF